MAPPTIPGGRFRVLERHQFKGMDFAARAAFIHKITALLGDVDRYRRHRHGHRGSALGAPVLPSSDRIQLLARSEDPPCAQCH
ncbi:hypothetical protein [Stenotrophomonas maltophilia]|uniref:hypothetical protein n=1 Tax=Stenotrophomonas maltophilia TaxID=40324 RepID=UPI003D1879F6